MNIILCGLPNVGKTTIGQKVSEAWEIPFKDSDDLLESLYFEETGKASSCREIYYSEGKEAFRSWERIAIQKLSSCTNTLIAIGGGALEDEKSRSLIRNLGKIVFLKASLQTIKKRMEKQKNLPAYLKDVSFEELAKKREMVYEEVADVVFDLDRQSLEDIILYGKQQLWANI